MQIVTGTRIAISFSDRFLKIRALKDFYSAILPEQLYTFSSHQVEHYIVSVMGHQHHTTVSVER